MEYFVVSKKMSICMSNTGRIFVRMDGHCKLIYRVIWGDWIRKNYCLYPGFGENRLFRSFEFSLGSMIHILFYTVPSFDWDGIIIVLYYS